MLEWLSYFGRNIAGDAARSKTSTEVTLKTVSRIPSNSGVEFEGFRVVLAELPAGQREALILVGASSFSYEEAAAICECAVGTIKSRVNRARMRLSKLSSGASG
jgi:DNA-directed RNA polymerase specialized sigma24 family protein